ncbi:Uncharacterised protein [Mycobacteroides abscessus subsp. abscessus]|nr:Uncharacterised protein [Mycobacteroides abscessus subsp. abscessus]SKU33795.1 Uncharacterised protein [Mycobacteroides abscessus subsp. abscessus]SKW71956.1 Uncharacterised protein [Mycobacteroides abscessus subsp. abscessus]
MRRLGSQSGAEEARSFSKNDGWSTPLGHRLRVTGRPAICGNMKGAIAV